MLINVLVGGLIFGYAGWSVFRYVRNARKGKCAACELNSSCKVDCK